MHVLERSLKRAMRRIIKDGRGMKEHLESMRLRALFENSWSWSTFPSQYFKTKNEGVPQNQILNGVLTEHIQLVPSSRPSHHCHHVASTRSPRFFQCADPNNGQINARACARLSSVCQILRSECARPICPER